MNRKNHCSFLCNSFYISENYVRWKREVREIVKNMPLYPIQLLSDADDFANLFINKFFIDLDLKEIRFLENIE